MGFMQKQINGKRYDTESAKFVTITKYNDCACAVYLKKTKELFCQNLESKTIIVLTPQEQTELLKHPEIKKRISEITEFMKAPKIQINPYITLHARAVLTTLAEKKGLSESEIIEKAIIELEKEDNRITALRESAIEKIKQGKIYFT